MRLYGSCAGTGGARGKLGEFGAGRREETGKFRRFSATLRARLHHHQQRPPPSHQPRSAAPGQVATPRLSESFIFRVRAQHIPTPLSHLSIGSCEMVTVFVSIPPSLLFQLRRARAPENLLLVARVTAEVTAFAIFLRWFAFLGVSSRQPSRATPQDGDTSRTCCDYSSCWRWSPQLRVWTRRPSTSRAACTTT